MLERIEYFSANTTICSKYVFPIAFGFMLASIWPWIAFAGSKVVSRGVARTKEFQIEEAHKVQLRRIKLRGEIQDEQDRIARERENTIEQIARQRKQAVDDVGEENLQRVKESFEQLESVEKEEWEYWSNPQIAALLFLKPHGEGLQLDTQFGIGAPILQILGHNDLIRARIEIRDSLRKLEDSGYVKIKYNAYTGSLASPTAKGYEIIDRISAKY